MKKIVLFLVVYSVAIFSVNATIRYVKPAASGTGSGLSWANASNDLQEMINQSGADDEVWVTAGIYVPSRNAYEWNMIPTVFNLDNTPYTAFVLKNKVKVYGGFAGTEILLSQRNIKNNPTILKANVIPESTFMGMTVPAKISFHVVISAGDVGSACLDGFIIQEGNANGVIYTTSLFGGVVGNHASSIIVNNETIYPTYGGGIYLANSSPKLQNLQIINNEADYGAAIYSTNATVTVENVFINGNTVNNTGIIYHVGNAGRFKIVNGTVCGNNSNNNHIIYNSSNYEACIYNTVFWNNNYGTSPFSGYLLCSHSCIQGYIYSYGNGMVNTTTPYFVDPNNNNYRLQASSPLRNAGNNNSISSTILYDLDWNTRKMGTIDIGAYEYQGKSMSSAQKSVGESFEENNLELNELIINVFPNPATDQLNINSSIPFSRVSLVNMLGQTIKTVEVGQENYTMDVSNMAKGLYILKVDTPQGSTTKKIQIK
jgi:hypothetical protein